MAEKKKRKPREKKAVRPEPMTVRVGEDTVQIQEISKLSLGPNEFLIVRFPDDFSKVQMNQARIALQKLFQGRAERVLFYAGGELMLSSVKLD